MKTFTIIARVLTLYREHLEKGEYLKSYKKAEADQDIVSVAEEGLEDYRSQIRE